MSAVAIALSPPWSATAELDENGCNVYFKLFHDSGGTEDKALEAQGFVKWDGCSNWSTGPDYLHFCDAAAERAFAEVLVTLRREAELLMGDKAQFSDSQPMGRTTATLTKMTIGGMPVTIRPAPAIGGPADNTDRCPICSMMPHVHGCTPGKCGASPFPPREAPSDYPLPWRWGREGTGGVDCLIDAIGGKPIRLQTYDGEPEVEFASPYVHELLALAPEFESVLARIVDLIGDIRPAHPAMAEAITLLARLDAVRKAVK